MIQVQVQVQDELLFMLMRQENNDSLEIDNAVGTNLRK